MNFKKFSKLNRSVIKPTLPLNITKKNKPMRYYVMEILEIFPLIF